MLYLGGNDMKQVIYAALLAVLCGSSVENTSAVAGIDAIDAVNAVDAAVHAEPERKKMSEVIEVIKVGEDHIPVYKEENDGHHPGDHVFPAGSDAERLFIAAYAKGVDLTRGTNVLHGGNITPSGWIKYITNLTKRMGENFFAGEDFNEQLDSLRQSSTDHIQRWIKNVIQVNGRVNGLAFQRHQQITDKAQNVRGVISRINAYIGKICDITDEINHILNRANMEFREGRDATYSPDEIIRGILDASDRLKGNRVALAVLDGTLTEQIAAVGEDGKSGTVLQEQKRIVSRLATVTSIMFAQVVERIRAQFSDGAAMAIVYDYVAGQIQDDSWNEDNHDILKNDLNERSAIIDRKTLTDRLEEWTRKHGGEPITTPEFFRKTLNERQTEVSKMRRQIPDIIRREFRRA